MPGSVRAAVTDFARVPARDATHFSSKQRDSPLGVSRGSDLPAAHMEHRLVLQLGSLLCAGLFALGAVLFFTLMRRPWARARRYIARGGSTTGVVVGHAGGGTTESGYTTYAVVVEYRDPSGRPFRIVSPGAATHPDPIGTQLPVAYDVAEPSRGVIVGSSRTLALVGTGLSALFALLSLGCLGGLVALSL